MSSLRCPQDRVTQVNRVPDWLEEVILLSDPGGSPFFSSMNKNPDPRNIFPVTWMRAGKVRSRGARFWNQSPGGGTGGHKGEGAEGDSMRGVGGGGGLRSQKWGKRESNVFMNYEN